MQFAINTSVALLVVFAVFTNASCASSSSTCSSNMNRDDAINLLAEASAKAAKSLARNSMVDDTVIGKARQQILSQLREGWDVTVREQADCSFLISLENPNMRGGGLSVRADADKRILEIFQQR